MFLSAEHLYALTGKKRPKAQCAFLAREGYRFRVNSCGEPVVLEEEVRRRFGMKEMGPAKAPGDDGPDLDWRGMAQRGMVRRRGSQEKTQ
jgi:hypothetical protein